MTTPHAPMHHTLRFGVACAIAAAVLIPTGIGLIAGVALGEHHSPQPCTQAGR